MKEKKGKGLSFFKCLITAYLLSGILLLALSAVVYKADIPEKAVSVSVIVIYAVSAFLAGYLLGRIRKTRKFVWGGAEGAAYFLILLLLSFIVKRENCFVSDDFWTTLIICTGGGILGGMIS